MFYSLITFFLLFRLFEWLVTFINSQIRAEHFDHYIGKYWSS